MIKGIIKKFLPKELLNKYYNIKVKILNKDDFEWSVYNKEYSQQISEIEKEHTLKLLPGNFSMIDGKIVLEPSFLPLHPNHKILYETIYDLKPLSLLEVGSGGGDHLSNLKEILPKTEFNGCDLLKDQMNFLHYRHPELKTNANLFVHDITTGRPNLKVDLVYTQAVIMHIKKNDHHMNALRNIFQVSNKYLVLMENWRSHNFYNDIRKISEERDFPWKNLHIYSHDDGHQILMIVSNTALPAYKELSSDKELLKYL